MGYVITNRRGTRKISRQNSEFTPHGPRDELDPMSLFLALPRLLLPSDAVGENAAAASLLPVGPHLPRPLELTVPPSFWHPASLWVLSLFPLTSFCPASPYPFLQTKLGVPFLNKSLA